MERFAFLIQKKVSHLLSKCGWMNLGYWKKETITYDEACQNMACLIGDAIDLNASDYLLDNAVGYGPEVALWRNQYQIEHLVCCDPSKVSTDHLKATYKNEGAIYQTIDEVKNLEFTKIVVVDGAYHFKTREQFFQDAYALLRPGGKVGLTDIILRDKISKFRIKLLSSFTAIPEENFITFQEYEKMLQEIGFHNIHIETITDHVLPPFADYLLQQAKQQAFVNRLFLWCLGYGVKFTDIFDYVVIDVEKANIHRINDEETSDFSRGRNHRVF